MNLSFFKIGVERGVNFLNLSDSLDRRLEEELLDETVGVLELLGLLSGLLFCTPYSSDTVSEIISVVLTTGVVASIREVPIISRWPDELLYLSFVSGISCESSSFLSFRLKVLFPDWTLLEFVRLL